VIIRLVAVKMVNDKAAACGACPRVPVHMRAAPVAQMGTKANPLKEDSAMLKDAIGMHAVSLGTQMNGATLP
jgi:hypothetical protein